MTKDYDYDKILQGILDIGEEMIVAGAEVSRVEDSISRMCRSYGGDRINVFIIISNIQVTMETPDGRILTHIRQVIRNDVNFDRLDYLNDLSRKICETTPDWQVLQEKLEQVMNRPKQSVALRFLGCILGAGAFTLFFRRNLAGRVCFLHHGYNCGVFELFWQNRKRIRLCIIFWLLLWRESALIFLSELASGSTWKC